MFSVFNYEIIGAIEINRMTIVEVLPYFFFVSNFFLLCAALYKMVCQPNDTDLDIDIPAIMLPQDAGTSLELMLNTSPAGKFSLSLG